MSISKKKKLRNRKSRKGKNFLYRLYGSYGTAKEQRKGKRNRKSRKPKNFLNRLYGGYGRPNILKETTAELTQEESDRMERERRAIERPYSPLAPNWMGNMEAARARKAAAAERALAARAANEAEEMAVAKEMAARAVATGLAAAEEADVVAAAEAKAAAVGAAERGAAAAIQRVHEKDLFPFVPRDGKGRVQTFHSYETEAAAAARAEREARAEMAARAEREARAEMAARAAAAGFAGPGTRRSQHKSYSPSPYTTVDQELERCNSILMVVQRQLEELQNSVIVNP